ncbi:SulP family inorganic anion transporter [Cyclobacterium plantarum]|uniref:Solute carrier 26 family protein n=1 Tax=Cyclobacterium plantarum TaxID=2716263 RepID=A0ABX0H829_9BACT|nr:solute carrier family 26 protein [Cyclobacterium plantarum]NHE58011.1 solute carrier 26 family protein [Cyclobacterium plantarum]
MDLKKYLPFLQWLPDYNKDYLKGDLSAGITVGIMLIPQGMAYAMLAGLEPIHGLYAVTVPLILYAIFGSSRQLAVGPVAMVSLLTAAGISSLGPSSPAEYLLYALTLAFLVGLIQFIMGAFRLGFVVNFLSHPVINGFTSAAAIIIGLSQIKHLFKINLPNSEHIQEMALAIAQNIGDTHWLTLGIGLLGILIIKFGKRIHPALPAPLIAVIAGILLVWGFGLTERGVKIVGEVPSGLPTLSFPSFDINGWSTLLPIALTISLVGFAESFAVAKTIQAKHKNYKLDANQELMALGMANFGAAFFNGYPVTGGFSRTAVNNQAGAKTTMASVISAILILLTLLFFTGLFYYLPSAILAAVVLVAVAGLIDLKEPFELWKKDKTDFAMLIATFLITLTLGIETGIITGMILSLLVVIYRASRPHMAQLGRVPGTKIYRNIRRFNDLEINKNLLIVRIDGPIYFANVEFIRDKMNQWLSERKNQTKMIVFNMESVTSIDSTGAHALYEWIQTWRTNEIDVCISGTKGPIRDVLNKWKLIECIGADHMFMDDYSATAYFDQTLDSKSQEKYAPYAIQSNVDKK